MLVSRVLRKYAAPHLRRWLPLLILLSLPILVGCRRSDPQSAAERRAQTPAPISELSPSPAYPTTTPPPTVTPGPTNTLTPTELPPLEIPAEWEAVSNPVNGVQMLHQTSEQGAGNPAQNRGEVENGEVDVWGFQYEPVLGAFAQIVLTPLDRQADYRLTLRDPAGEVLSQVDNGLRGDLERLADVPLEDFGLFMVEVEEINGRNGQYELALNYTDQPAFLNGGTLVQGDLVSGFLTPNRNHVWFFEGRAQEKVSIVLSPLNEIDLFFSLLDTNGEPLATYDESFAGDIELIASFELPYTGKYQIVVQSFSQFDGGYTLSLDEGHETISTIHDAGDLNVSTIKTEVLQPGEIHAWFFAGEGDDRFQLTVRPMSGQLDLDVWVLTERRERVLLQDDGGVGDSEQLEFELPYTGTYIVLIQDYLGRPGGLRDIARSTLNAA